MLHNPIRCAGHEGSPLPRPADMRCRLSTNAKYLSHPCALYLQARIVCLNGSYFLKNGGHFVISIKANCIDSTVPAAAVFESERGKLAQEGFKPQEQLTLEPYERDHAVVTGTYRGAKKKKN